MALRSGILGTGLLQPVESGTVKGKIQTVWVLSRQVPGQERHWLVIANELLDYADNSSTEVHLCRRYVLKNGHMVFGWHLALSGPPRRLANALVGVQQILAAAVPELPDAFTASPAAFREPVEDEDDVPQPPVGSERSVGRGVVTPSAPVMAAAPPRGFVPGIRVVRNEIDEETGRVIIEEEVPLPHVYHELNRPTPGGRGAQLWSGYSPRRRS